jgi:hypothetical protein
MTMKRMTRNTATGPVILGVAVVLVLSAAPAAAGIDGIEVAGSIDLYARADYISSADGASLLIWGLTDDAEGRAQYPAPTLIFNQGDTITVTLHNELSVATSLVFPGHDVAGAGSCTSVSGQGPTDMTCQVGPGESGSYTFPAEKAGTYMYHSGTDPALQVEMGVVGAIVVRPFGFDENNPTAYGHPDTAFDREYLFILSEMDSRIHEAVEFNDPFAGTEYLGDYFSNYWFINGRTAPDTMAEPDVAWLPTQPYNILPQMLPGERVLMRVVAAGRDPHPYHHHGNHALIIGRNGNMPSSAPGQGPDLGIEVFTMQSVPGETYDAIFTWTGENMGWDIYGTPAVGMAHDCVDGDGDGYGDTWAGSTWEHEYCADHYKPIPVDLPENLDLAFGAFWSGSPYMGTAGALPPGEGGLNPNSGYTFMWHSHTEKELTNNDIFPGGMLTMLIVNPPGTVIE